MVALTVTKSMLLLLLLRTITVAAWSASSRSVRTKSFGAIRIHVPVPVHRHRHRDYDPASRSCDFRRTTLHSSSMEIEEDIAAAPKNPTATLSVEAHSGLSDEEFSILVATVEDAYAETVGLSGISCETETSVGSGSGNGNGAGKSSDNNLLVGSLRRVLSLRTNLVEESAENLRALIAERMDHLIYGSGELRQPVLVTVRTPSKCQDDERSIDADSDAGADVDVDVDSIVRTEIEQYGLRTPVYSNLKENDNSVDDESSSATMYTPTYRIEIDGAETQIDDSGEIFWDTSSVVVFDDLVSDDLRRRLLDVVKGKSSVGGDWNDVENGPDPSRWIRGGLQDVPDSDETERSNDEEAMSCWGLPAEAIEEICFEQHEAIEEFESILTNLFPQFVVSRFPEAVYGECVSPLTANAPVAGEEGLYDYHIDGDPLQTPPSPWTDVYGRYPNRSPGKPRFVSCLVYLNDEWDASEWGASTSFYDPPTDDSYEVAPRPGRCVILDQDVGHTVTPPNSAAGKRPRYSLVWKLVFHPKTEHQDMTELSCSSSQMQSQTPSRSRWPEPVLFGSASNHRS